MSNEKKKPVIRNIDGNISFTIDAFKPKETEEERLERDITEQQERITKEEEERHKAEEERTGRKLKRRILSTEFAWTEEP